LLDPRDVPRRRPGSAKGRRAILHAVAHIELNAVDLHWDVIARFSHVPMPIGFFDDWVRAADEESKHFNLVADVLDAMDCPYGSLPAHAGMWRAAEDTADDLMARLAVVPMVLEARGLDVTPGMIDIFRKAMTDLEDGAAAAQAVAAMEVIYAEEVHHVAYGSKWFHFLCGRENLDPKPAFHAMVRRYFHGALKPPFNEEKARRGGPAAGLLLAAGGGAASRTQMSRVHQAGGRSVRKARPPTPHCACRIGEFSLKSGGKWLSDRLRQGSVLRQPFKLSYPRGEA
jgi:uncharacterized ferritin-like protein (DUF455 family)